MKVLTVIENYSPFIVGGAEVTVETYINHIISDYEVKYRVLTGAHTGEDTHKKDLHISRYLAGVQSKEYSIFMQIYSLISNIAIFIYNIIVFRPDIIEFVPNNYSLYPMIFFASLIRYPLVVSVHNNSFGEEVSSIGGWLNVVRKQIITYLNKSSHTVVITISMFMKKNLIKAGIDSRRMIVLYNPVDTLYPPSRKGNYAVFASRLVKEKGTEEILRAFSHLKNVGLHIYGDGDLLPLVKMYAKKHSNIKYFGKVSEGDVVTAIRKSNFIIAHPMFEEPFGRYIVHSFSTLKPLVSSFSGAVTEMIHDHENGLLVQKGDVDGIIGAVRELESDNFLYKKIVSNLKTNRFKYDIETVAKMRLCILSRRI